MVLSDTNTLTSLHLPYISPYVKALLRHNNQLMRAGRTEEAGSLSRRNGAVIIRENTAQQCNVDSVRHLKDIWAKVRELINPQERKVLAPAWILGLGTPAFAAPIQPVTHHIYCPSALEDSYHNTHPLSHSPLITFSLPANIHYASPLSSNGKTYCQNVHLSRPSQTSC